jgi:hypothetical protein
MGWLVGWGRLVGERELWEPGRNQIVYAIIGILSRASTGRGRVASGTAFSLILAAILSTIVPLAQFQLFLAATLLRGDLMIEAAELAFREQSYLFARISKPQF